MKKFDEFKNGSLFDFSAFVKNEIKSGIAKVSGGAIKIFYDSHSYQELALCVKVPEDMSQHKTIHKAKGDEFDNVMLVLKDEKDLEFILHPNIDVNSNAGEEQRINYVAVSRAKNRLFISVPTLKTISKTSLQAQFQIEMV